jgi:hypothetical protein
MKKIILLSLLCIISMNAIAKCTEAIANITMGKISLPCLKVKGSVILNGTTIQDHLILIGELTATAAHFNRLNIKGDVILNHSTVSGKTDIEGKLKATDTVFSDNIYLKTNEAIFDHSTIQNLEVSSNKTVYVFLNNHSTVNGNIIFKNKNGIVKNNHSSITGKVIGGTVEE